MKNLLLFSLVAFLSTKASAIETIVNGIQYFIPSKTSEVCWVIKDTPNINGFVTSSNYSGIIVIPENIVYENKTYIVSKVNDYAFFESSATLISLPNTIKEIGKSAFSGASSLEKTNLPTSLETIPESCFSGCESLKTINIPKSVSTIKEYAFSYTNLDSIRLPNHIQYIGAYAFAYSKKLKKNQHSF